MTVVSNTFGLNMVLGQSPDGHVDVTNAVGIRKHVLQSCLHVADVGSI